MIAVIDYGMGNLRSVQKAFELFYPEVIVSSSVKDVLKADKVILPGVGAFGKAMEELQKRGLDKAIKDIVKQGKPFLGICLGIQLLFSESEEGGRIKGLDIFKGRVRRFSDKKGLKIPHMGWNKIGIRPACLPVGKACRSGRDKGQGTRILKDVPDGSYMYFVHSYYAEPEDRNIILCETEYGINFVSAMHKDNVYAFQFHPEKSQTQGLKIVKNFVELC